MPEMTPGRRGSGGWATAYDDRPPLPIPDQRRYGKGSKHHGDRPAGGPTERERATRKWRLRVYRKGMVKPIHESICTGDDALDQAMSQFDGQPDLRIIVGTS